MTQHQPEAAPLSLVLSTLVTSSPLLVPSSSSSLCTLRIYGCGVGDAADIEVKPSILSGVLISTPTKHMNAPDEI
ncbi:hypothetical protein DFJ58DRAFT_770321 [Suillus subalutaceus]|uniref:uncharacterized protein n=1 Tax=Suillus subalutaceus TaxID=48586 RepID=UPI001B8764F6|nr:uncharacterized protein DFJ58DRAFT_770321 [Suillus subalutaceus]KAG1865800.1 hypothetical protein DFJ58DRAFT_770321 [Suillus subalutaceus]